MREQKEGIVYELDVTLRQRIERLLGQSVVQVRTIQRGYTPALRLVVTLADHATVFVKVATTDLTAAWLRQEQHTYTHLSGSFMPRYYAGEDDAQQPLLVLEDLSAALWPPPWTHQRIDQVLATLAEISHQQLPGLTDLDTMEELTQNWQHIAEAPEPFLQLGLATERWLKLALPTLLTIDTKAALRGDALLHGDVRSDNICFLDNRSCFVDWNAPARGNPNFDIAAWLPSLASEGGPRPETILPHADGLATLISGFFAARAGLPIIPTAPRVRAVQLQQLRYALPWTVRILGLPALDGPKH